MSDTTRSLELPQVRAEDVHEIIGQSMLKDGFPFVLDLDKSQGSRLVDKLTGRGYLDFFTYFATQPIGHNHPAIVDPAFQAYLGRVALTKPSSSDFYTEEMAGFVQTLRETAQPPSLPYLFMVAGGALAVENGLKAAFDWKYQKRLAKGLPDDENLSVIHFKEAFHGRSGYTLSLTNTEPTKYKWFPKFHWPRVSNPKITFPLEEHRAEVEAAEQSSLAEIQHVLETDGDRVAALIIEPIQGEGGDNHFRGEFLRELRRLTLEHDVIFIVDEVQTGMGTSGKWWAYQHFGFEPDILCFGKKMQVCGILAGTRLDEVESVFDVSSRINSTWGGCLTDMVRGARYLQVIQADELVENAARQGEHMLDGLRQMQADHPGLISNVRGRGTFVAFTFPSRELRNAALIAARGKGLLALTSGATSVRFRPPLTVSRAEVEEAVAIMDDALGTL